ncbi:MAG: Helix-turn-helix domain [Solirubrobacterales bacterium]|nr:Helix-turn-helix domain [Solirubrobacterales bacterium]
MVNGAVHSTWLEVLTDPVRLDVLFALSETGAGSAGEVARRCHATERTVKRHLDALVALGLAHESREGSGSERLGRPPTRFILDGMVRERARAMFALLSQPLAP